MTEILFFLAGATALLLLVWRVETMRLFWLNGPMIMSTGRLILTCGST